MEIFEGPKPVALQSLNLDFFFYCFLVARFELNIWIKVLELLSEG